MPPCGQVAFDKDKALELSREQVRGNRSPDETMRERQRETKRQTALLQQEEEQWTGGHEKWESSLVLPGGSVLRRGMQADQGTGCSPSLVHARHEDYETELLGHSAASRDPVQSPCSSQQGHRRRTACGRLPAAPGHGESRTALVRWESPPAHHLESPNDPRDMRESDAFVLNRANRREKEWDIETVRPSEHCSGRGDEIAVQGRRGEVSDSWGLEPSERPNYLQKDQAPKGSGVQFEKGGSGSGGERRGEEVGSNISDQRRRGEAEWEERKRRREGRISGKVRSETGNRRRDKGRQRGSKLQTEGVGETQTQQSRAERKHGGAAKGTENERYQSAARRRSGNAGLDDEVRGGSRVPHFHDVSRQTLPETVSLSLPDLGSKETSREQSEVRASSERDLSWTQTPTERNPQT